jgi:hypothetical protein
MLLANFIAYLKDRLKGKYVQIGSTNYENASLLLVRRRVLEL